MVNQKVSALNKSATLKITALTKKLRAEGRDVVNFAAGEPDFDTPDFIKEAAHKAIDQGFTKYTPSAGLPVLRQAIASKLANENKIKGLEPTDILVTAGAKYALYVALTTLLSETDEVLLPSPYWVSYPEMVTLTGASLKVIQTNEDEGFKLTADKLKASITSKSKVLILNYPSNPTGQTYTKKELEDLYDVIKGKDIFVVSDEIYETLLYDGQEHTSFASIGDAADFTITVNGFSKTYSMTGWRLGYLAGPTEIISAASKIIDHSTSCACAVSQKAAVAALENPKWKEEVKDIFEQRRDLIFNGLTKIDKINPLKSQGTFYMFCDISKTKLSSFDFASQLLEKHLVSCIPALPFGQEGFIRISFATGTEQIEKGLERIARFVQEV